VKGVLDSTRTRYVARLCIFLITIALVTGMVGCDGYNFPPSKDLEIRTWYDLDAVRDNLTGHHTLMNDLDSTIAGYLELAGPTANGGKGWQPIGFPTPQGPGVYAGFMGTFDGQGHEIHDLFINRSDEDWVGLFGWLDGGWDGGGIIRDISNVNVTVTGQGAVGGLVGKNMGTMTNSYCSGNVTGGGRVGGVVGDSGGIVNNCYSTGTVTGESDVGGLVGFIDAGNVSNSCFTGKVRGEGSRVGGLVGLSNVLVSNCYSTGGLTGDHYAGGLVGWNGGTVSNSYSRVSVTGDWAIGGLVGGGDGIVRDSYSTGIVIGNSHVGGLVGRNYFGTGEGTVSHSFWDTETSGQATSDGGTGKTTAEMQNVITFSDAAWSIIAVGDPDTGNSSYVWNIVDGETYPFLSWEI
jgi:hypothetical protein